MGSRPERQSSVPEWPRYSQEMRGTLYPHLIKQLRGELTPGQQYGLAASQDRLRAESAIAREQLLRDMGRMPGVPGPERYEGIRRLQDAQIRAMARLEAQTRIGAEQQAMAQALNYAMQSPAQRYTGKGASISTGAAMGRMIGTAALQAGGMYLGGQMGGAAMSGATPSSATSMPTGGAAQAYPEGFQQSFSPSPGALMPV